MFVERWRREYNHIRPAQLVRVSTSCSRGHYPDGSVGIRFRSAPPHAYAQNTNSRSGTKNGGRSVFPLHEKVFSLCSLREVGIINLDIYSRGSSRDYQINAFEKAHAICKQRKYAKTVTHCYSFAELCNALNNFFRTK